MMASLIEHGIRSPAVLHAMAGVPREEFVLSADRERAYADRALPIDAPGQTISQPLMVAAVVEALELHAGDRALDVGTGSGYQAAVMAACGAHVVSIERVERLARDGRRAPAAARLRRRGHRRATGRSGFPERGALRCDRGRSGRSAAAGGARPPARRGRPARHPDLATVPNGEELTRLRLVNGHWETESLGPCRFVPLIGADGYTGAEAG